jgi:hypothetical protein
VALEHFRLWSSGLRVIFRVRLSGKPCLSGPWRRFENAADHAEMAEWLMAADCKSATLRVTEVRILLSAPKASLSRKTGRSRGNSSVGRASAFQAECRGFEPRFPLHPTRSAFFPAWFQSPNSSVAERVLGKDEVAGSIPALGSTSKPTVFTNSLYSSRRHLWPKRNLIVPSPT